MTQTGGKLVTQILHGIVRLKVVLASTTVLIEPCIRHYKLLEGLTLAPPLLQIETGVETCAKVVEREGGGMIDIVG